jgi:hypothetical protein
MIYIACLWESTCREWLDYLSFPDRSAAYRFITCQHAGIWTIREVTP